MKKILSVLLLLAIALVINPAQPVHAKFVPSILTEKEPPKDVLVLFKYYNTATWGETTKNIRKKVIEERVLPALAKKQYSPTTDDKYFSKLESRGYGDLSSVEKADVFEIFKDDGFKYVVFIDMEPIRSAGGFGYETTAQVKIFDIVKQKHLFIGKMYQLTKWGGAGTAAEQLGDDIVKLVNVKIPQ